MFGFQSMGYSIQVPLTSSFKPKVKRMNVMSVAIALFVI